MEISGIGSYDDSALLCHTNRPPFYDSATSGGDWWAPDWTRVSGSDVPGFTRNRGPMVVRLKRISGDPQDGIYQCTIEDAELTPQIVYAGLYNTAGSYNRYYHIAECIALLLSGSDPFRCMKIGGVYNMLCRGSTGECMACSTSLLLFS